MNQDKETLGDAQGQWFYCFKHSKVETREECHRGDRLGPYPSAEAAANWKERVSERNQEWEEGEDDE